MIRRCAAQEHTLLREKRDKSPSISCCETVMYHFIQRATNLSPDWFGDGFSEYCTSLCGLRPLGVMKYCPLKFLTARKILPLLDLLAKFKRVLACSCSPNFCVARKLAKQIFYFFSCSQKNRSARHARECSQRPFVTPLCEGSK